MQSSEIRENHGALAVDARAPHSGESDEHAELAPRSERTALSEERRQQGWKQVELPNGGGYLMLASAQQIAAQTFWQRLLGISWSLLGKRS